MKQDFTVRGELDGAFRDVAGRSFRKAAAEFGIKPSAIRQAVRAFETRIGAAVSIRTTRSVSPTEAGERFLLPARPSFEEPADRLVWPSDFNRP
jgi:DNA-binding transcriptional LysR family regulator